MHMNHSAILNIDETPLVLESIIRKSRIAVQGENTVDVDDYQYIGDLISIAGVLLTCQTGKSGKNNLN